jgi:hypothetical protein
MPVSGSELGSLRQGGNEPFGSRLEPGARLNAFILLPLPGEAPEGRAEAPPIGHPVHPRKRI